MSKSVANDVHAISFEQELQERSLLAMAQAITAPLGLRVRELRYDPKAPQANALMIKARMEFARNLKAIGWSHAMIARLIGYRTRSMISFLINNDVRRDALARKVEDALVRKVEEAQTPSGEDRKR